MTFQLSSIPLMLAAKPVSAGIDGRCGVMMKFGFESPDLEPFLVFRQIAWRNLGGENFDVIVSY